MAGHHDPRTLYSIQNVEAFHIQNGQQDPLTTSGPQTMTLLMVPSTSPFADLSSTQGQNEAPEVDFYLHIHIPPELDLPLLASTQVYPQPPRSYLIPRPDLGHEDSGAFTKIVLPPTVRQEDLDTFETILAQCTAFMERAPPPTGGAGHKPYNPAEWAAGGKMGGGKTAAGQIVLVDEDDGSVVGELADGANIVEDPSLGHGSKSPVEVEINPDGRVTVRPVSEDYLRLARHPAYSSSTLVQNAAAASRLIVTGSGYLGNLLTEGADTFSKRTNPSPKPLTFSATAHSRVRKLHAFTDSGAALSSKTVGHATKYAQNLAAHLAKRGERKDKSYTKDGQPIETYRPGFMNKSMIAFSTIADGIAESGRSLLTTGGAAATQVIGHRYGPEAGDVAGQIAGGVKNVGLVYIDVTGVSRRAIIKSVAKGMVVGKVQGGGEVVVGGGDGGMVPDRDIQRAAGNVGVRNEKFGPPAPGEVGFGVASGRNPAYESELGEPLGSSGR